MMEWISADSAWFIIAVILLILEIVTPGFVLASFSIAAIAAGACQLVGLGLGFQLFVFAGVSLMTFATLRPLAKKYIYDKKPALATNADALIGKEGKVIDPIKSDTGFGRVKLKGGEDWRASSLSGDPVGLGEIVKVVRVEGATLIVTKEESG